MGFRYKQEKDGEWVQPKRKYYRMACCDCGLVHIMEYRVVKNGRGAFIQFRCWRDNRATGQIRRGIRNQIKKVKP